MTKVKHTVPFASFCPVERQDNFFVHHDRSGIDTVNYEFIKKVKNQVSNP